MTTSTLAAGPSSTGSSARDRWATASTQPRKKYKTFVTPGPDRHRDTLGKVEVLHHGSCSAACPLCTPLPCPSLGRETKADLSKKPWLHWPSAKPNGHSLGLALATLWWSCCMPGPQQRQTGHLLWLGAADWTELPGPPAARH